VSRGDIGVQGPVAVDWAAMPQRRHRSAGEAARGLLDDTVTRIRRRGRAAVFRAFRLTGAAVASYVVASSFSPHTEPLLAPLTALLVVQVTLYSTLTSGIERVVSVMAGVLLAVLFAGVTGVTWWSLGILIAISIVLGQLLKLGPNVLEVPISAMLVLGVGVGAAGTAAFSRFGETVVGAVVGVVVNLLWPPAVRSIDAGAAVEDFANRLADLLDESAAHLAEGPTESQARDWLEQARRLSREIARLDTVVESAEESRRLNVRALGTPEVGPVLRDGLEALEHAAVAIRTMFRSVADAVAQLPAEGDAADYAADVRSAFALLLGDLGDAIRSFGRLVRAEVDQDPTIAEVEHATSLEALREARARVAELLLIGPRDDPEFWALNVAVLATVERVLRELDVEEHVRLQERRRRAADEQRRHERTAQRIRATARQLGELPAARRNNGGGAGGST
jgi:hypothetical protein